MDNNQPTPGVSPSPPDIKKTVSQYVALRDRKRQLEKQHSDQLKPFVDLMAELEGMMLDYMQRTGSSSIATDGGTAYLSTVPRATINDAHAFRSWVISNNAFELADWRANAPRIFEYIKDHNGQPPPGVNPSTFTSVRFRSPGDK